MIASLVALAAGLGVVVVVELNWQRAINTATAAGLVAQSGGARPVAAEVSVP